MSIGEWLVLAMACGAGVLGLLLASSSAGETISVLGMALFVGAVIYAGLFVKRHFDRLDQQRQ